jgi:glycosyltransferase involved in cell wall biosynthesis
VLIGHVYKDVYPPVAGGIEKHIHSIRSAGGPAQHEVIICSRGRRGRTIQTPWGLERQVAEYGRLLSAPIAPGMAAAIRASSANLFHVHMPNPTGELAALVAGRRPYVVSYHADVVRQAFALPIYRPLIRRVFEGASGVVVASRAILRTSPQLRGVGHATVIPYGVDTSRLRRERVDPSSVDRLRSRYGHPFVLAVGRLVYYKGFDVLIDAAARGFGAPVVIVGDGPVREGLVDQVRSLGLAGKVTLVGRVTETELFAHYAAASAFVLPSTSRAEAFGIVTAEAQSFGLPVVVTELETGTTEAMLPGTTGLVVDPNDARSLATAVENVLNPGTAREMGEAARKFAEQRLSLTRMAASLQDLYERALAEPV